MDQIQAVCYTCRIGYLCHVEIAEPQGTPQEVRAPVCPGAGRPRGVGTGDSALPHTSLVLRRPWQRQRAGPRALACIASADQSMSLGAEPGSRGRAGRLRLAGRHRGITWQRAWPQSAESCAQCCRPARSTGRLTRSVDFTYIVIRDYLLEKTETHLSWLAGYRRQNGHVTHV